MNKVQRQLEQKAYAAIAHEYEEEQKLGKIPAHDKSQRREQKRQLAKARRDCCQAIERYERFAAAKRKAHEAMDSIDVNSGERRTGEQTRSLLEAAADERPRIDHAKIKEVARYIRHRAPGLSLVMAALHTCLQALFPLYTPEASAWLVSSCTGSALCESASRSLYRSMSKPATCLALSLGSKTG